ncbi:hypothetical protein ACHRVW_19195 [Flavobacterium collinsii]|uniref:hypothetical protein n=1 Tax=Flavobacterium collinsii TaxID=1114861 RepID=UPI0022BA9DFF|nr:hypothetical protein [Flavobacterium collinsii]GIQ59904.1 hypothetical protein Flavo103_30400 [Flavobacterium collinsii]
MIKKLCVLSFICFFVSKINAQEVTTKEVMESTGSEAKTYLVKDFSEGVYKTYENLIAKSGIFMGDALERRTITGYKSIEKNADAYHVFFCWKRNNAKITDYFAIVYNGSLYIQQRYLMQFASKEDGNMSADNPNSYHRVLNDGKFLYLEGPFANMWSKAFAYNAGAVGGAIAANLNTLKGIVFNVDKKEFNFIRECENLNALIEEYNGVKIECKDKKVDILTVRENVNKIIK